MTRSNCPKCEASMKRGFLLEETYGSRGAAHWVEGAPEKSFLSGVRLRGRKVIEIESWRCSRCGYLEHYAAEKG